MIGLILPTLVAALAAIGCGGSLRALFNSTIRGWAAVVAAFAIELVLFDPPVNSQPWAIQVGPWVWVATRLLLLGVLCVNAAAARTPVVWAWRIAALGVGLNTLVVALNDAHMPQSLEAAVAVWGASHIDPVRLQNVAPLGAATRLPWLADVIAEPEWLPRRNVISIGDVLLALGVASWVFWSATLDAQVGSKLKPSTALSKTVRGLQITTLR